MDVGGTRHLAGMNDWSVKRFIKSVHVIVGPVKFS